VFPLLVAGAAGWGDSGLGAAVAAHGLQSDVRPLGYVDEAALAILYCGARVLLWPSLYEGFGLPPLECMASGTPVIASNTSAIPEVVGDAGRLVDPLNVDAIADALRQALEDDVWHQRSAAAGLERSRRFSWESCAAGHAQVYRATAGFHSANNDR
jgi:alpha-1,3-rhamnosyl/mannosyltransferase